MKLCILIGCHKDFDFVKRIISKLKHKDVDIWLNIDKKADVTNIDFDSCYIIKKRYDVRWGDISQIDTTINALKEITNYKNYDRIIFISGQDYPIKPINEIIKFFKNNKNKEYINYTDASKKGWDLSYRWERYNSKYKIIKFISRILPKKKFINGYEPYAGATWFNITGECAKYIVKKYEEDNFHKHFKTSICIDELIIPTILMNNNSPFKNKIENKIYRYIDWSDHEKGLNNGNPNILKEKDYKKIIQSDAIFARKFDPKIDNKILDKLDKYMEKYNEKNINSD